MKIEEAVAQAVTIDDLRRIMDEEIIEYNGRMLSVQDALALYVLDSFLHGVKLRPGAYHFNFRQGAKGKVSIRE